jgi:putative Mn2+ efflux pump MntP
MNFFLVIPVALALSMDVFAVSIGLSLQPEGLKKSQRLRLALFFGFFQFVMPLIGWLAGQGFLTYIRDVDHWVAFGLLLLIGGKMLLEAFRNREGIKKVAGDPTKGMTLILLSVATSIDALAVGLSLAAIQQHILFPAVIIGAVAFVATLFGTMVGPLMGRIAGKWAEFSGGLILIFIGIKILTEHL